MRKTYPCTCKRGEHTVSLLTPDWAMFYRLVKEKGEDIDVTYAENGKTYIVPRIYIAIHGLKGKDLPSLGFTEKNAKSKN
jgi:hypothetical protein